jgi:hypothetical protein
VSYAIGTDVVVEADEVGECAGSRFYGVGVGIKLLCEIKLPSEIELTDEIEPSGTLKTDVARERVLLVCAEERGHCLGLAWR